MAPFRRPNDFIADLRRGGEAIRQQELQSVVRQFVRVGELAADSVTAAQIVVGAVGSSELANGAVGRVTIQNGAVNADKVEARTLSGDRLIVGTLGGSEVADGSLGGVEIANNSITAGKLSVGQLSAITGDIGVVTAGLVQGATVQSGSGTPRTVLGPAGLDMVGSPGSTSHNGPSALTWFSDSTEAAAAWCFIGTGGEHKTELVTLRGTAAGDSQHTCGIVVKSADASTTLGFLRVNAAGTINGSSGTIVVSDAAAKDAVVAVDAGLDTVRRMRPRRYRRKLTGRDEAGFIAQELREVIPQAVVEMSTEPGAEDELPMLGIDHNQTLPYLVRAVQELAAMIDALGERVARLEPGGRRP